MTDDNCFLHRGVLFGTLIKYALATLEMTQAIRFFLRLEQDPLALKFTVAATVAVDAALLMALTVFLELVCRSILAVHS